MVCAMPKVLILVGPTSSGKSALAVKLARKFDGEIVSADSRQVYKGLDVGTGKITKREMRGVRHHMLDVASPKKTFSAHDYRIRAEKAIEDILDRKKLPIITGGTGFYIDALVGRISLPDVPANLKLRRSLATRSAPSLYTLLCKVDSARARVIDKLNKRRLIRAIEIAKALGTVPHTDIVRRYDALWIGLEMPREVLNNKIRTRLVARMKGGMLAEAKRLHADGLSFRRMDALGLEYRSLAKLLQKKISRAQCIEELDSAIRHYAKRQMTYWRRNKDIKWFSSGKSTAIEKSIRHWLR